MRPEYYADLYRHYISFVRKFGDNKLYRIACGPYGDDLHWTETMMKQAGGKFQGMGMHYYCHSGRKKQLAVEGTEDDWYFLLHNANRMDELLKAQVAVLDHHDPSGRTTLLVDEWGTWHEVEPDTNPGFLYQQNTIRDALATSVTLDIFNRHCRRVYGANIAEYYAKAMSRFPNRFIGLAQICEPAADQPVQLERLERAVQELGCKGLYFSVELFAFDGYTDHIDDSKFEPLWGLVQALGIPVWWYLDARRRDRVASFMQYTAEVDRWAERHPDIPSVLTHGLVPATMIHEIGVPQEVMSLLKRPNVFAEILMPAKWPEYPFVEGQEMLRQWRDEVGPEKLMWGSDMPFCGGNWCTYRQAADYIRLHCDFLSRQEKALILGGNAMRMFKLDAER